MLYSNPEMLLSAVDCGEMHQTRRKKIKKGEDEPAMWA